MKRAVSISIGSSKRDKCVDVELLGEPVRIERIGTDGDMQQATDLFAELDGKVDAFGVGGTNLSLQVAGRSYPLYSVLSLVEGVQHTPIADGSGLKNTIEARLAGFVDQNLDLTKRPRHALITSGTDRWGMTASFLQAEYDCIIGDLMFGLDIPLPVRSEATLKLLARVLLPVVGRLPFEWLYPTGDKQEQRKPKWRSYFEWASIIAGDCHFITYRMPDAMQDKIVVTNTTTADDVSLFKQAGVHALVTSTPVYEGRSFGTNMMEAALIAVSGKARVLDQDELQAMIDQIGLQPQLQILN
jgi:hypothetical protein